jgi:uncharacterized protein
MIDDYSSYVIAYKKRIQKEKEEEKNLLQKLDKKARKAAKILGEKYNLQRVYLFGSIVNQETFHLNSDIDLAVEGLKSHEYLEAWGDLEDILNHKFDLVQIEKANNNLKDIIENEGVVIYESGEKEG